MEGVYKIGKPKSKINSKSKAKKRLVFFFAGILFATVVFAIIMNLLLYTTTV